jgi:hypothetical protein
MGRVSTVLYAIQMKNMYQPNRYSLIEWVEKYVVHAPQAANWRQNVAK